MEIECFLLRSPAILRQSSLFPNNNNSNQNKNKNSSLKVRARTDEHPFFQSAISRATYRFQETLRPGTVFYACLSHCIIYVMAWLNVNVNQKFFDFHIKIT